MLYDASKMSETEIIHRYYSAMDSLMIARSTANHHTQEIMAKSQDHFAVYSPRSIISKFALRAKTCYFIIR